MNQESQTDQRARSATVRAPNSLILIDGGAGAVIPSHLNDGRVASTSSSVAIGTQWEGDGPTTVRLMIGKNEVHIPPLILAFVGVIDAPHGHVFVRNAHDEVYLSLVAGTPTVQLLVSVDDLTHPSAIDIRVYELAATWVVKPFKPAAAGPPLEPYQRRLIAQLADEVGRYGRSGIALATLCLNARGLFDAAGISDQNVRMDFERLWVRLDAQDELRTNPTMPPGLASEPELQAALDQLRGWAIGLGQAESPANG